MSSHGEEDGLAWVPEELAWLSDGVAWLRGGVVWLPDWAVSLSDGGVVLLLDAVASEEVGLSALNSSKNSSNSFSFAGESLGYHWSMSTGCGSGLGVSSLPH